MNIIGSCVENYACTNKATCGPCTNLYKSEYALLVSDYTSDYIKYNNNTANINKYLGFVKR